MTLKLTFQLTTDASIEAVRRMGGFMGSVTDAQKWQAVEAHRERSTFRMKTSLVNMPKTIQNYSSEGYQLIEAEEAN